MHRLRGVTLMTDRLREETIKDALVTLLIFRSHATAAQRIHERPGPRDVGPGFLEKGTIRGVPEIFSEEINELTVAVVFGNRVSSARVDTAGDLSIIELESRKPVDEIADLAVVTEAEQRSGCKCSITDPGALVRSRARLKPGCVAIDEDVGESGANRLADSRCRWRKIDLNKIERPLPLGCRQCKLAGKCRRRTGAMQWDRDIDNAFAVRGKVELVGKDP